MINTRKLAVGFAALFGGYHLLWAIVVAIGWAQPVLNFVFRLHFLTPILVVTPFAWAPAIGLVALTTVIGGVFGWLIAIIWNCAAR